MLPLIVMPRPNFVSSTHFLSTAFRVIDKAVQTAAPCYGTRTLVVQVRWASAHAAGPEAVCVRWASPTWIWEGWRRPCSSATHIAVVRIGKQCFGLATDYCPNVLFCLLVMSVETVWLSQLPSQEDGVENRFHWPFASDCRGAGRHWKSLGTLVR